LYALHVFVDFCKEDGVYSRSGGGCYFTYKDRKTFVAASEVCENHGGHLLRIESEAEFNAVTTFLTLGGKIFLYFF